MTNLLIASTHSYNTIIHRFNDTRNNDKAFLICYRNSNNVTFSNLFKFLFVKVLPQTCDFNVVTFMSDTKNQLNNSDICRKLLIMFIDFFILK